MKIDRLLSITLMLINRPMVTAKELSQKYEVSIRTIYRDMETISAAGIPVTSWNGKKGGFCLLDNYRIDRQILCLNEMISIITALKGVNTSLHDEEINETIEKIQSLVPPEKQEYTQRKFDQIIIDLAPWGLSQVHSHNLRILHEAITTSRLISFYYRNLQGQEMVRTIEPMSLVLKSYSWYIYGFCRNRNDYRIFKLSRIRLPHKTDISFTPRIRPFDPATFLESDKRQPVTITLRFSPEARSKAEEFFSGHSFKTDEHGRICVEVAFPEDEWVYSTLLSFGGDCEVVSPSHIREKIHSSLQKALSLYKT